eukprot:9682867-Alexandrium_andersonii.AAC.1
MAGTWMLLFGPPWQAGGPPRTMWVDGQRLVFNNGTPPPAAGSSDAAPAPSAVPAQAGPAPPSAAPAAAVAVPAAPPAAPPSDVEPFLG